MTNSGVILALGSGGAKGLAHVGVLKALDEHSVPVQGIAGSSMGALVGALYATGTSPRFMEALAHNVRRRHWADWAGSRLGLLRGNRVREMVRLLTRDGMIQDAKIPIVIVATDLLSKSSVVMKSGSIADAVRASISIPGVFTPVVADGTMYVDGGVSVRVPIAEARSLGDYPVIAVDVSVVQTRTIPENMMDVVMQSLDVMQDSALNRLTKTCEVMIQPDVSMIGSSQFHKVDEAIAAGHDAVVAHIDEILHFANHYRPTTD